jgi:PAS domain S-box-containing protein
MPPVSQLRRFSDATAGAALVLGVAALTGWVFDVPLLRMLVPAGGEMSPPTALCFALSGLALIVLERREARPLARAGTLLAGAVLLFSGSSLVEIVFAVPCGLGQWLFPGPAVPPGGLLAGRMPVNSIVPFVLASLGMLSLMLPSRIRFHTAIWFGLAVGVVALLGLLSHVLFWLGAIGRPFLAFGSALGFVGVSAALTCAGFDTELLTVFSPGTPGRRVAQLLIAGGLLIPLLLYLTQIFWLLPNQPGLHDAALVITAFYGLMSLGVAVFSLRRILRSEQLRSAAEAGREALLSRLQQQAATLQYEVAKRTHELQAALAQNTRFAHLANHTINGVLIADSQGRIEWVNPAWERCTGYTLAEVKGRTPGSVLQGPDTDAATAATLRTAVHRGEPAQAEILNYTKSRKPIWVEVEIQPFRDEAGRITNFFGIVTDITARRDAEAALRFSEARLQAVWNQSVDGMRLTDAAGIVLAVNDAYCRLAGMSRAELVGRPFTAAYAENTSDSTAEAQGRYRERFAERTIPARRERRIQFRGGQVANLEVTNSFIDLGNGQVALLSLIRDITTAKEMQEQLRIAEERWKLAITGNNDGVWDWNPLTGEIYSDDRSLEMIGHKRGDLAGQFHEWEQRIHPDDLPAVKAALDAHLSGRSAYYLNEHRLRHKQGHWIWVLDRGKVVDRDNQGNASRLVGTHTDISSHKSLEERLRHSEEMSLQVSRLAQIGAWEWDLRSQKFTWTPEIYRIFEVELGFQPTFGRTLEFFPPESRTPLSEAINKAVQFGRPFSLELPMTTTQSHRRWVRVIGRASLDHGHVVNLYGAIQDITERHDAEETRRQLETQLFQAQKMETLGTLAGGIAHDFNNLLTGVLGYQDLALDTVEEGHAARAYLNTAREASLRARELVDQILTFSRDPGGERIPVDLAQVIEDARRFLRSTVPATVRIEVDIAPGCGRVLADSTQLHQVLLNLGSNAAHAMRAHGGALRIALAPATLSSDRAGVLGDIAPGDYLRLTVSDTGHGMDPETMKRIFDPFFTTKSVGEGTGLGLSVVHGIVRAHKGAIEVRSTPGQGTTFTIHLPLAAQSEEAPEAPVTPTPRGAGQVIAVVDDEDFVLSFTKLALIRLGYHAVAFDSPVKCLEALRGEHADCALLLTDQTMPGMKGIELAAQVREIAPTMPAIIMSGYFSKISPDTLTRIGRVSLIAKPFTADELARAIQRALHGEG